MFPLRWNFPFRKKDGSITTIDDAISSGGGGGGGYTLPTASASTKGGVKIGSGLSMDGEVLNNSNPTPYSLPTASAETLGGVKVGSGLSITDGVLSASGGGGGGSLSYYDATVSFSGTTSSDTFNFKTENYQIPAALDGKKIVSIISINSNGNIGIIGMQGNRDTITTDSWIKLIIASWGASGTPAITKIRIWYE